MAGLNSFRIGAITPFRLPSALARGKIYKILIIVSTGTWLTVNGNDIKEHNSNKKRYGSSKLFDHNGSVLWKNEQLEYHFIPRQ